MARTRLLRLPGRKGAAATAALTFLVVFASLAVTFAYTSFYEAKKSANHAGVMRAQLAAESGLSFMLHTLRQVRFPCDTPPEVLTERITAALNDRLADTPNLGQQTVEADVDTILVPPIHLPQGTFQACLVRAEAGGRDGYLLAVTGTSGEYSRSLAVNVAVGRAPSAFDYAIASRGKISVKGNGIVTGMNAPAEAKLLSTKANSPAIQVAGSATVGGELYVTGESQDYIELGGGGSSVAGSSDPDAIRQQYVHLGIAEPEFPEIRTADLIALAVNTADANTPFQGSGLVYENLRIPAEMDPVFRNDAVINGVLYVESPNVVSFRAGVTINGTIVTEHDPSHSLCDCLIEFRGHASAPGMEALPDEPQFAAVKQHTGTAILAPGFALDFRGNTGVVNGVIAADKIEFRGNSTVAGELSGTILGLTDNEMLIQGSSEIRINRLDSSTVPAGFSTSMTLLAVPDTYVESLGN